MRRVTAMFFRPSFCANCGEKIERADWSLLTSRRFCDLCVTEMPVQEYAPKIVVGIAILASAASFLGYLRTGSSQANVPIARQRTVESSNVTTRKVVPPQTVASPEPRNPDPSTATALTAPKTLAALPPERSGPAAKAVVEEMYFCGAQTKKGSPCSRRVKGNVRCYQHTGMPAMAAGEKLRVD